MARIGGFEHDALRFHSEDHIGDRAHRRCTQTDTHQKALRINLDPRWYGTVAEIGAGQEVVRWFFRVGGAAGTVAKSMSAYDMAVSDAVYGKADRYVSAGRLQGMLDKEFQLNVDRLGDERGDRTRSSPSPTPWWRAATGAATSATAGWA